MRRFAMISRSLPFALGMTCLLASCGQAPSSEGGQKLTSVDIAEEPPAAVDIAPVAEPDGTKTEIATSKIAVSVPRIAYTYGYQYRLAASRIAEVQSKQADLCEKQGPAVCRVLDMQQHLDETDNAGGSLTLAVAAPRARAFGAQLSQLVSSADGQSISSSIQGEDLSKQIVDTTARLKARTLLRDRLMEILATRKGTVAELVEAERGVAKVNEEIDEATGWLAEMQGRVDYSRMELTYSASSATANTFLTPIKAVVGNLGWILGTIIALLIALATVAIPLGLVIWGIRATLGYLERRREIS